MSDGVQYVVNVVRRSELQAGDILVLTTKSFLTDEMIAHLKEQARGVLPAGVKVMVIDGGVDISAILSMQAGEPESRVL